MLIKPENSKDWKLIWSYVDETKRQHKIYMSNNEPVTIDHVSWYDPEEKDELEYYEAGLLNKSIIHCSECWCLPELRISKATGKFYCTCPSSFYLDDDEEENNVYLKSKLEKNLMFDTMEEAIKQWNKSNLDLSLLSDVEKMVKDSKNFEDFKNTLINWKIFKPLMEYSAVQRLQMLLHWFGYTESIYNKIFIGYFEKTWFEANECCAKIADELIKLLYLNIKEKNK